MSRKLLKGTGAQFNPHNKYQSQQVDWEDEELYNRERPVTQVYTERPKNLVNKNSSTDIPFDYSMNPYQGCEHGCSYCYARVTHEYWGLSAGLDFESKIMVKENAPELLRQHLNKKSWKGDPIMLSGNTDCYQPLERKYELTRRLLEICLDYRQPVSIITKNSYIERDLDLLTEMARQRLVTVVLSLTTADESLRRIMEPRTSTFQNKLSTISTFAAAHIPVGVNLAPVIPAINDQEIPEIIRRTFEAGAQDIHYSTVRLNGAVADVFLDWLSVNFPDRQEKVINGIMSLHNGSLADHQSGRRMTGTGHTASIIRQLFRATKKKYYGESRLPALDSSRFLRAGIRGLFDE